MKIPRIGIVTLSIFSSLCVGGILHIRNAHAQTQASTKTDIAALEEEVKALKRLLPSQSHAMADVDFQFSNLWFAGKNSNWPLADFYVNETRSHLNWTVRLRPVRRLANGGEVDLRPILQGVEDAGLTDIKSSIMARDIKAFEAAYRATMNQCYGCHMATEKPYLRLHIPETPATRMIDLHSPNAD